MERRAYRISGFLMLGLAIVFTAAVVVAAWRLARLPENTANPYLAGLLVVAGLLYAAIVSGFVVVNPNEARVVQFFGRYVGSLRDAGFHWTVPFSTKRQMSLRVRNFESARLKVSDADGNPVEIAAVVVWRVVDSAKAMFAVDDHVAYVAVQAEAAVRHLATSYPYEAHDSGRVSLREGSQVSEELTVELRERVALAGVEVLESRITHLAYAPEIAQAMLARQQASAIVAARFKIVEGAVGMVSAALERLRAEDVVDLDEERKAQMVANLLVVLCGDRAAQPVVNTGTLYG
jgi:regulator of protease activity HflC (stomatin/prohibitin superfamily)